MFHKELVILDKILNLNHVVRWWLVGGGQKNLTQTHRRGGGSVVRDWPKTPLIICGHPLCCAVLYSTVLY